MLRDRLSEMEGLQRRFAHSIEQITSLHTDVILVQPGTIPRAKARRSGFWTIATILCETRHHGER